VSGSIKRRLIINADDLGRSEEINAAVIQAHRNGVLTSASLMVNEPAFPSAVRAARQNPGLGVGLHLALLCGRAALSASQIPGLINANGQFSHNPLRVGLRYFFQPRLREQLRAEIHAQFARFRSTGLPLDHLNGHLHLHLHPAVLRILMEDFERLEFQCVRLTFDPLSLNLRLASGRWCYRLLHAAIFQWLAGRARHQLMARRIRHTPHVFGVLQHGRVDEAFVLALLDHLPAGDSELYSHPSLGEFKHELDALISPRVRERIAAHGIQLIRYQDL
jgi:chitin disaccharide deacetylase